MLRCVIGRFCLLLLLGSVVLSLRWLWSVGRGRHDRMLCYPRTSLKRSSMQAGETTLSMLRDKRRHRLQLQHSPNESWCHGNLARALVRSGVWLPSATSSSRLVDLGRRAGLRSTYAFFPRGSWRKPSSMSIIICRFEASFVMPLLSSRNLGNPCKLGA